MARIIRLTESDLTRLIKRVIKEQEQSDTSCLKQFTLIKKGSRGRQGTISERDYWFGKYTYKGMETDVMVYPDGTLTIFVKQNNKKFVGGKWKCENGNFTIINSGQESQGRN
jgi:hypothetical protein